MRMTMTTVWLKVDEGRFVQSFQDARGKLNSAEEEVVFDFSTVLRIDPSAIRAMEEFATIADDKGVKIVLRGVSTGIYKVFKLVKLASRFVFTD